LPLCVAGNDGSVPILFRGGRAFGASEGKRFLSAAGEQVGVAHGAAALLAPKQQIHVNGVAVASVEETVAPVRRFFLYDYRLVVE